MEQKWSKRERAREESKGGGKVELPEGECSGAGGNGVKVEPGLLWECRGEWRGEQSLYVVVGEEPPSSGLSPTPKRTTLLGVTRDGTQGQRASPWNYSRHHQPPASSGTVALLGHLQVQPSPRRQAHLCRHPRDRQTKWCQRLLSWRSMLATKTMVRKTDRTNCPIKGTSAACPPIEGKAIEVLSMTATQWLYSSKHVLCA